MTASCFEVRESDGYINATKLAQAAGKFWGHYNENAKHQVYLAKLQLGQNTFATTEFKARDQQSQYA